MLKTLDNNQAGKSGLKIVKKVNVKTVDSKEKVLTIKSFISSFLNKFNKFELPFIFLSKADMDALKQENKTLHESLKKEVSCRSVTQKNLSAHQRKVKELQEIIKSNENQAPVLSKSKLQAWSKRVRLVGKCDICGTNENLTAHHLWDKSTHQSMAYQDENGVCLCRTHHESFHKKFTCKSQTTPGNYQRFKTITQNEVLLLNSIKERAA